MFKLKVVAVLTIVFFMGSYAMALAENPFAQYYIDQTGGRNILEVKSVEIPTGKPQLVHGTYVRQDNEKMGEDNYYRLGQSLFSASSINERDAVVFGRKIHAGLVVLYAPYTLDMLADDPTALADFQEKASVWRSLAQKPPLPEEAHKFRVLADDAIKNNEFDKAAAFFENGLAVDPMWPVGQYNAALICAELKEYSMAAMLMKHYLMLKPDDKNARAYQDKVYIWQEKAQEIKNSPLAANRYDFLATYWIKGKTPILGVLMRDLTLEEKKKVNSNNGVMVISVLKNSPAFMADIFKDDIIQQVNGVKVVDMQSFLGLLKANSGKNVTLAIIRDGQEIAKSVQLNA